MSQDLSAMNVKAIDFSVIALKAIDVHAHFGAYRNNQNELKNHFTSGDIELVAHYANLANISYTMVSPYSAIFRRGGDDLISSNNLVEGITGKEENILFWVVVDPLEPETYLQAEQLLRHPRCAGIKIHPEEHCYPIKKYGGEIFEFAARHKAIIESHSGEPNSIPEDFIPFADEFPDVRIIVSHLGCGWDGDPSHQVRAIQKSRNGNVFTDTSSSQSIMPRMLEWAVKEIGASHILFGTDSPGYFAPMQRARVDYAEISDEDKKKILCDNAKQLFHIC